jgi:hypothetical protein
MRLAAYGTLSVLMAGLSIANAFYQHQQFYPATIYLSKSSASSMVGRCTLKSS